MDKLRACVAEAIDQELERQRDAKEFSWPYDSDLLAKVAIGSVETAAREWLSPVQVGWRTMESAPKDGTWIIAQCGDIPDERWSHMAGRCFVIKHMGVSGRLDMGWALYPGMGVGDDWLCRWMPLPASPTTKGE